MKAKLWISSAVIILIGAALIVMAFNNSLGNASYSLLQGALGLLVVVGGAYRIYSEKKNAKQ